MTTLSGGLGELFYVVSPHNRVFDECNSITIQNNLDMPHRHAFLIKGNITVISVPAHTIAASYH